MSSLIAVDAGSLKKGDRVVMKTPNGKIALAGQFFCTDTDDIIYVQLDHTKNNMAFDLSDWNVFVEEKFPLPEKADIEATIYNMVTGGNAEYGLIAEELLRLMRGEVETPVIIRQPEPTPDITTLPPETE